jgi:hypothetical protein
MQIDIEIALFISKFISYLSLQAAHLLTPPTLC